MVDPLIDDDEGDLGWVDLVVLALETLLELGHFFVDALLHLLLAKSVSVDDDLVREAATVVAEMAQSFVHASVQVFLHNLLELGLENDVTVGACELLVRCGDEADHRVFASVTNVNADEHHLCFIDALWKLDVDGLAT